MSSLPSCGGCHLLLGGWLFGFLASFTLLGIRIVHFTLLGVRIVDIMARGCNCLFPENQDQFCSHSRVILAIFLLTGYLCCMFNICEEFSVNIESCGWLLGFLASCGRDVRDGFPL
jgi:hypothetical protein